MTQKKKVSFTLDETLRRDLILFNNPVLVQGLALTPVVAAATTLKVAAILSIALFILLIPTRLIGDLLVGYVAKNLRMMSYAIFASLFYIPAILLLVYIFGTDISLAGSFLPMLVVDGAVLSRAEIPSREGAGQALRNGVLTAIGVALIMGLMGAVRELLGAGRIWGIAVFQNPPLPIAGTVAGGFMLACILAAALQWSAAAYKRVRMGGREDIE